MIVLVSKEIKLIKKYLLQGTCDFLNTAELQLPVLAQSYQLLIFFRMGQVT